SKNELSVVLYWHHNQNCKGTRSRGNATLQDTASRGHCSRDEKYPRFPAATPAPRPCGLASGTWACPGEQRLCWA
ncbi:Monocarboxylate Transporter 6, partial [Manis pentadactyla]